MLSTETFSREDAPTGFSTMATVAAAVPLLDRKCVEEIRYIERAAGRHDLFSGFVCTLERNVGGFMSAFCERIAEGDALGAARTAHTLKGACLQLGARALGNLFAEIESSARAGDYAEAKRRFAAASTLIAQSLEALKQA